MKSKLIITLLSIFSLANAQDVIRGPYLQNPTASSIVIKWRTDVATTSRVQFGTNLNSLTQTASDLTPKTNHRVVINGLQPYTTYYYQVGDQTKFFNTASLDYRFKTFPAPGASLSTRIWVIGDFGKANTRQSSVRDAFVNYDADEKTDLWLWLGDNAYSDGTDAEYQQKVFDSLYGYKNLLRKMHFHPTPGNHDYNSFSPLTNTVHPDNQSGTYLDVIDVPMNGENGGVASGKKLFYSFDYGDIHFVNINTELASLSNGSHDWLGMNAGSNFNTSPMKLWLEQDLAANTKHWTVLYLHQPPHSAGSHVSASPIEVVMRAVREKWAPIFEQYGVDLVLAGHSHVYERSLLMNGYFGNGTTVDSTKILDKGNGNLANGTPYRKHLNGPNGGKGTVYIVSGNGGSSTSNPPLNHAIMVAKDGCSECLGSLVIDVNRDTLTSRYLKANGTIGDEFTIIKTVFPNSIQNVINKNVAFKLYPNPTNSELSIEVVSKNSFTIEVTDIKGKSIWKKSNEASDFFKETIQLKNLGATSGSYLVSLCDSNGQCKTEKVVLR
jgi:hypothetical protein